MPEVALVASTGEVVSNWVEVSGPVWMADFETPLPSCQVTHFAIRRNPGSRGRYLAKLKTPMRISPESAPVQLSHGF